MDAAPQLVERNGGTFAVNGTDQNSDSAEAVRVVLSYAQPLSDRDRHISILNADTKEEMFWLSSLDQLDQESKTVAESALADRYRIATIERILHSHVNHGHRYLRVTTDRGERYFNLREPGKNVTHFGADRIVIRDSMGNRYEIPSLNSLDAESRQHLDRVL